MVTPWISVQDLSNPTDPLAEQAVEIATLMLYKLSGQRYPGTQTITEKYKLDSNNTLLCYHQVDLSSTASVTRISSPLRDSFFLRGKPVVSVELVEMHGEVLPITSYAVADRSELARLSGLWDLRAGVTVTYTYGLNPPEMGKQAAITLANEFLTLWSNPDDCRLPEKVTSVTRQGLTYQLSEDSLLSNQKTGIWEVDAFIAVFNPDRAKKRPKVFSPDVPRGKRYI